MWLIVVMCAETVLAGVKTRDQLLADLEKAFPAGWMHPAHTAFQQSYKLTLAGFEGSLTRARRADLATLEGTFVDQTVALIGASKVTVIAVPVELDRGVASRLAWDLLDWALESLKGQGGPWESTLRSAEYNRMRKFAVENGERMSDWGRRFLAKTIQAIFTYGYDAGIKYGQDKCEAKNGADFCRSSVNELKAIHTQVLEKSGSETASTRSASSDIDIGEEAVSETDKQIIAKVEKALTACPKYVQKNKVKVKEIGFVDMIRKIESPQAVSRLLDKVKEKLERVSHLKEENWVSDPRVAFFQIGIRMISQDPELGDDFRSYNTYLWSPNALEIPPFKESQLWSTFNYYFLLKQWEEGKGAIVARELPQILPFRKPFIPPPETREVHQLIRDLWDKQIEQDRLRSRVFAPSFVYMSEVYREQASSNPLFVQPKTPAEVTKEDVLIEGIAVHKDRVIKWQSTCAQDSHVIVPDILRDYWFARIAGSLGVSQQVYYLSPPAKFPKFVPPKMSFAMSETDWATCAEDFKSSVRFMIMERIQFTVADMIDRTKKAVDMMPDILVGHDVRFQTALVMASSIVKKLKTLHNHENPIVHGDVHMGNIAIRNYHGSAVPSEDNFVFIDFGKAFFNEEFDGKPAKGDFWGPTCMYSSFNYNGFRSSFRDDVYRALLTTAFLMNDGRTLRVACAQRQEAGTISSFHGIEFIFDPPTGNRDIVKLAFPRIAADKKARIRSHLGEALRLARAVPTVNDKPDYDGITGALESALELTKIRSRGNIRTH
jgi:hypothetical protein